MVIIVGSEKEKQDLIAQSKYIHNLNEIDSDRAGTLMHIYMNPNCILVDEEVDDV